jgi:hypothetical protein
MERDIHRSACRQSRGRAMLAAMAVSRGGFTAAFFLQCLSAIGCNVLRLDND